MEELSKLEEKVDKLISRKYNLEDIGKAFSSFEEKDHHIKSVISI